MKFVDLFAGLGGFHLGLNRLGHDCVFACEANQQLRDVYRANFGIVPHPDIRLLDPRDVPKHEILCAGFPCQPFSKAGEQQGFGCPKWGGLFDDVAAIIDLHKPEFVLLENVPNLQRHNKQKTWTRIFDRLKELGYDRDADILSPHQFGIPQIRQRVFIVARRGSLGAFNWPTKMSGADLSLAGILECDPPEAKPLSPQLSKCLDVWQEFLDRFPKNEELPSWPIWSMEFGATYPFENTTPHAVGATNLRRCLGSHGIPLTKRFFIDPMEGIPSHGSLPDPSFPAWKKHFLRANRALYARHHRWIDPWMEKIIEFPPSLQKLEWNCKGCKRNIWNYVIQIRASGVRVKRPNTTPSLIAMTTTQVPIIAWERRYITLRECAKLQALDELKALPKSDTAAFKALGNAVNSKLVEKVALNLIGRAAPSTPAGRPVRQTDHILVARRP